VSSDVPTTSASTNIAGVDLALLVDQLTRTGSSPEMTATVLSTLVATSPDAGPDEQKQILHKLTEALRERQRQIELQKVTAVKPSSVAVTMTTSQAPVSVSASTVPSTAASVVVKPANHKPAVIATKESVTRPSEAVLPKTTSTVTAPAPSVATASTVTAVSVASTSFNSPLVSSCSVVPSSQQWVPDSVSSSVNVSILSSLPVSVAATSAAVGNPPATSALPLAVQQMLSGQSFENLKNILANVTSRKTGGIGIPDLSSIASTSSAVRSHEMLDSYTTSKGSRSDLLRMVPESDLQPKKSSEQDELFVANVHGDVDYRMQPPAPSNVPKSVPPFSVAQSRWTESGGSSLLGSLPMPPLPPGLPVPLSEELFVGGSRSLLPGPFPPNSSFEANSSSAGPLLPNPLHTSKPQALLPTPEKPSGEQEERGRESREGHKPRSEDDKNNRDQPGYKDRRPADDRPSRADDRLSSRDNYGRRQGSRERPDADRRPEQRDGDRSMDQSVSRKPASSYGGSEEHGGTKLPLEEGPIIIDDDCADIPLPPLPPPTAASKPAELPAEGSIGKSHQHLDTDRKALLPTPAKQDSAGEKRKSDDLQRERKFSRWDHRRSLKTPPSGSKGRPETKHKKALLATPVASGSSESVRSKDSAGDGYGRDAKDSRTAKYDSDSKSHERRRSRSRSATRHVASNLVDRSRRRFGLVRRQRSSSRDRRHSSRSGSRAGPSHDARRRSRSRERPAPRSTSRDRLEEEEKRLRKQLDELVARKNEGSRGGDRQHSPAYGQDRPHEKLPALFDVIGPDARPNPDQPLPRRHLLPAPHLVSANLKGKPLLDLPDVLRPADTEILRPDVVDRERGMHFGGPNPPLLPLVGQPPNQPLLPPTGQSPNQPLLPPAAVLPGRPFVQEYSHKPAETPAADPLRFREVIDYTHSGKDAEPNRPRFREEPGQRRRFRPYLVPEDRRRMPPESTERARMWHAREQRQKEQRDVPAKPPDFNPAMVMDRTEVDKVRLSEASILEHSAPAFSAPDRNQIVWQSPAASQPITSSSVKQELPVVSGESVSSAPDTLPTGESSVDNTPGMQAPAATSTAEAAASVSAPADSSVPPLPCPPLPPHFPAFVNTVRNMMFARGIRPRVPFNPAGNLQPPPMPSMFRPPPNLFPPAASAPPCVRPIFPSLITSPVAASEPSAGQSAEASAAGKKQPLLGDCPAGVKVAPLMAEIPGNVDPRSESVQRQRREMPGNEQPAHAVEGILGAPPRLLEADLTRNTPISQLPLDSGAPAVETSEGQFEVDESADPGESGAIRPLMDFSVYGFGPSDPRPPRAMGLQLAREAAPPRGRMPAHSRGRRPPAKRGDPGPFPRRGGPPFPPRGGPRYPQHHPVPPKMPDDRTE